ncbi:hypothetical protein [Sinorhizobium psoraleae]|uniref:Uncharacterized protein n=1 Tax=Sinorhizobium psoraleae TaxID=520838 RepID=A0ABT4KM66_9HYPH|nr:hypothetical protein [Sinorhizobium psoraleae]MCZ4093062.1 hypothetical protein [Sinorhizobium psoraleae]
MKQRLAPISRIEMPTMMVETTAMTGCKVEVDVLEQLPGYRLAVDAEDEESHRWLIKRLDEGEDRTGDDARGYLRRIISRRHGRGWRYNWERPF